MQGNIDINLPDSNISQYSLYGLVKYSIYSQYVSIINTYSTYKSTGNNAYRNKLVSLLRNIALLCISAFGGFGKDVSLAKYPHWKDFVSKLTDEKSNDELLREIKMDKIIYELSMYLNAKNVTDLAMKPVNVTDAFTRGG